MAETIERGQTRGELWRFSRRVSDRRREDCNLRSWALADGETQSQSIVVSARGWLVVNPLGVAEPTVGWKRAPLSVVAPTSEVISDKCFVHIAS
jgi:hypothetical protein